MKIPKSIPIAGKTVKITIDAKRANIHGINGMCFPCQDEILLDDWRTSGVTRECIEQTLIHEILHYCNVTLSKNGGVHDMEDYVNPLSELLYQVIKRLND